MIKPIGIVRTVVILLVVLPVAYAICALAIGLVVGVGVNGGF